MKIVTMWENAHNIEQKIQCMYYLNEGSYSK